MINKKYAYLVWAWGTTLAMGTIILATAFAENLTAASAGESVIKVAFRMLLYAVFFILLYRSIIATLKSTVNRLAKWRNSKEAAEDAEFVLIIETLVVIITILASGLLTALEEFLQQFFDVAGRRAEFTDVLVSLMAILLTALVVYTIPAVGELEFAIKKKLEKEANKSKKSKK